MFYDILFCVLCVILYTRFVKRLNFLTHSNRCSVQSVENNAEEIKKYYDANEISDRCRITFFTMRRMTMFTFETEMETPVT